MFQHLDWGQDQPTEPHSPHLDDCIVLPAARNVINYLIKFLFNEMEGEVSFCPLLITFLNEECE